MRNKVTTASTARRLLENARYEILPTASIEATVLEHVPVGHTITVTASPKKGLGPTLDLAERLTSGKAELGEVCDRLVAAGITAVFVPAGDQDPPAGDYHAALDLLEDLESLGRPFPHVGITGYPESHPTIHDDVTVQAMWDKRRHATHVVSNLTFDANQVVKWVERLRSRGVPQPVLIGLPGPVERTKLLTMATRIGVGESTRFLKKNKRVFAGIATPGGYDPMKFVERCARTFADPAMHVEGLHVFTFNQVAETEQWRQEQLERLTPSLTV